MLLYSHFLFLTLFFCAADKKKKQVCFWQGKKGNNKVDLQLTQANILLSLQKLHKRCAADKK
jgi:hypothetical protein